MTENEFYCNALLQIAGNSEFAIDFYNDEVCLTQWARGVEQAATVLYEITIENNCLTSDEPPKKNKPP